MPDFPNELVEAAASGLHDLRAHAGIRPPVSMWPPTDPDEADEYRMEARAVLAAVLPLIRSARTDVPDDPDGRSVPDPVVCAACGGSGDRNGNLRAADPFGTCPGCNGTGVRPAPANPYTLTAQTTAAHAWNEGFAAGRSAERARLAEIDVMAFGKATCARFTYAEDQPYEAVGDRDSLRLRAFLDAYLRAALSEGTPDAPSASSEGEEG